MSRKPTVEEKIKNQYENMLLKSCQMFKYDGINIPYSFINRILFENGFAIFTYLNSDEIEKPDFYILPAHSIGLPNIYGEPISFNYNHASLKKPIERDLDNCVLIKNDGFMRGIKKLLEKYAEMLVTIKTSLDMILVNSRASFIITGSSNTEKESANAFIDKLINGEMSMIVINEFLKTLSINPAFTNNSNILIQLLEVYNYFKSEYYQEIGLKSSFNMKRESLNKNETEMNDFIIKPLIDNMLDTRVNCFNEINSRYGLDVKVKFNSAWRDNCDIK